MKVISRVANDTLFYILDTDTNMEDIVNETQLRKLSKKEKIEGVELDFSGRLQVSVVGLRNVPSAKSSLVSGCRLSVSSDGVLLSVLSNPKGSQLHLSKFCRSVDKFCQRGSSVYPLTLVFDNTYVDVFECDNFLRYDVGNFDLSQVTDVEYLEKLSYLADSFNIDITARSLYFYIESKIMNGNRVYTYELSEYEDMLFVSRNKDKILSMGGLKLSDVLSAYRVCGGRRDLVVDWGLHV